MHRQPFNLVYYAPVAITPMIEMDAFITRVELLLQSLSLLFNVFRFSKKKMICKFPGAMYQVVSVLCTQNCEEDGRTNL